MTSSSGCPSYAPTSPAEGSVAGDSEDGFDGGPNNQVNDDMTLAELIAQPVMEKSVHDLDLDIPTEDLSALFGDIDDELAHGPT